MDYSDCKLCPRACGVDREAGEFGFCGAGSKLKIYRYGPHFGEEPPFSGENGSGTIFFSHCTLGCQYCQNFPWSQDGAGKEYSCEEFADILIGLAKEKCHNWNLVSPTSWLPDVKNGIDIAKKAGFFLPILYNTSGFECEKSLDDMAGIVDIYVTDLRYSKNESAKELSGAENYVESARAALLKMVEQVGHLRVDAAGIAVSGVVCRILVLPGRADEAADSLRWLKENVGRDIHISVMSQYTPTYNACEFDEMNRMLYRDEYEMVCDVAEELEFYNGWIQDFIPDEGVDDELVGYNMKS
ncbi:MAG: radical SAM protein [Kiritimatiellae bacterium]|jgi:putative pyruvate formate lyase activating enzyme|nr:radical SAM protein [Kiritimatiellia bacterium]